MRRQCYRAIFCLVTLLLCFSCSNDHRLVSPEPAVTGPVPVSSTSYPFNAADHSEIPRNLSVFNYVEEEYIISGNAKRKYRCGAQQSDGPV